MSKNQYYPNKKHEQYFSLYWAPNTNPCVHIIVSKKGVHPHATKRNFVKRRMRVALKNFVQSTHSFLPNTSLKIVARRDVLTCAFNDLNKALQKSLKAIS